MDESKTASQRGGETMDMKLLLGVLDAFKKGNFTVRLPLDQVGVTGKIYDTLNDVIDLNERKLKELERTSVVVGKEGRTTQRAALPGAVGGWAEGIVFVNTLIADLAQPTNEMARVITAVASGDLSQKMAMEIEGRPLTGEFLRTAKTVNIMVDQLSTFASEVTRVAREVGTEGKLGGQASVEGVSGTWKDLTDSVNSMANNLTGQVRNIATVTTAVAKGDLSRKITVDVRGEMLELKNTVNTMVDQLSTFASEVTRVAREVGVEGKLGGQARVPGVAGTWKDLTDNVNSMAANLTNQVRAIAEVSTAVTKGDLTRSVTVEAAGELAALKDNVNEMIANLRETTRINTEQDWLKTNLTRFTRILQGQRDLMTVSNLILSELAPLVNMQHGVFYLNEPETGTSEPLLKLYSAYGYKERKHLSHQYRLREGLVGQAAFEKQRILVTDVPEDYVKISSGLGEGTPLNIVDLPILFEGEILAVIELASFRRYSDIHLSFFDQLTESIGIVLNTISATSRTEELLKQSQTLGAELQAQQEELTETNKRLEDQAKTLQASEERLRQQQEELQQTNEELEEKAQLMAEQNREVERKNSEIELARFNLEEKAEQLALTSKYKSEFLANMSHELRTPLNSMLILSQLLQDNSEGNLTEKQTGFAATIHGAGGDLLNLINDILDLAKIEAGSMEPDITEVAMQEIRNHVKQTFQPVADGKGLKLGIGIAAGTPPTLATDEKRLKQVLKNLLSNAFKFTEAGRVDLKIGVAKEGWNSDIGTLNRADQVIAFAVSDTGIGIPKDKQKVIFEAFQQADGTTSRKYGGTGLGLSISREIARMLGGEIRLVSTEDAGSTFTLYLPRNYSALPPRKRENGGDDRPSPRGSQATPTAAAPATRAAQAEEAENVPEPATPTDEDMPSVAGVMDDRLDLNSGDRTLLIVEDDINFAAILLDLARERGFKGLFAPNGEAAIAMAKKYKPDAITLDIQLPLLDGWTVLDMLKHNAQTRHIPVHVISVEEESSRILLMGAVSQLTKPVTKEALDKTLDEIAGFMERKQRKLLVVEDNKDERDAIVALIGNGDVKITTVGTGKEALKALKKDHYDCMVLDLSLPDIAGADIIAEIKKDEALARMPIIVYTGRELTKKEAALLQKETKSIIIKSAKSPERLLDETALFLHRVEANLSEEKRKVITQARQSDPHLAGKKVLIVDDDVRNIFTLTSVLERHHMDIYNAENGKDAINILKERPDTDVVLMDIMMPEMDGYETMQEIRKLPKLKKIPMIALTAKAMKGDREKCIQAGASDYISKPVDPERLLSLLRVWLYK